MDSAADLSAEAAEKAPEAETGRAVMVQSGATPSAALITRIKQSYRLALEKSPPPSDSVLWSHVISGKQSDVHDALLRDDDELLGLLSDPRRTNLYYGVDNLARDIPPSSEWASDYGSLAEQMERLATAMGIAPLFNPEGGAHYPDKSRPKAKSIEEIVSTLDRQFDGALHFANPFSGEVGIDTGKGVASYRAIQAIYQAVLARRYTATECVEIGGGMGRTAYFGHLLGMRYSIVDIPMTVVGQALFLAMALGEDAIWLLGDETPRADRIALLPPTELAMVSKADVVLNVDSLTEMGEATARQYVEWSAENGSTLLSINHEANEFTVQGLAQSIAPQSLRSRSPYWLREGYVQEVYDFSAGAASRDSEAIGVPA